jgi:NADH:ubiquinone oxidoreductase subunit 5 (subunit L)/multisubunit Na+/H+ antiporter MnhA subunit
VLVIGAITALFMGLVALTQYDIKRVVATPRCRKLGYMTAALGASAYSGGMFHLVTHAFFKALLFLAAGSVSSRCTTSRTCGAWRSRANTCRSLLDDGDRAISSAGIPGFAASSPRTRSSRR